MKHRLLGIALILVACGKSTDKKAPDQKPLELTESDGPKRVTTKQLVAAPLVSTASKAEGIRFTIELPTVLLKPPVIKDAYATWAPIDDWFDTPGFTVQYTDIAMADDEVGPATPVGQDASDRQIVRAEKLDGGGYLNIDQRRDRKFVLVEACRPAPGGRLCCGVSQRADKPIDDFDAAVALYTKICTSLKPAG